MVVNLNKCIKYLVSEIRIPISLGVGSTMSYEMH